MIIKFNIFEARKKKIFNKDYIDWIIKHDPYFNEHPELPRRKLIELLKKYLRWKLGVDKIYAPIRMVKRGRIKGDKILDEIYISSGENGKTITNSYTVYEDEMEEFINFLNDPEFVMTVKKFNL